MARRSGTDRQSNPFREDTVKEVWNKGKAITDSKTYITGWTGNQGNKRKLRKLQSGMQKNMSNHPELPYKQNKKCRQNWI